MSSRVRRVLRGSAAVVVVSAAALVSCSSSSADRAHSPLNPTFQDGAPLRWSNLSIDVEYAGDDCGPGERIVVMEDGTFEVTPFGDPRYVDCVFDYRGQIPAQLVVDAVNITADEAASQGGTVPCQAEQGGRDYRVTVDATGATWVSCGSGTSVMSQVDTDSIDAIVEAVRSDVVKREVARAEAEVKSASGAPSSV